jgi:hypothetical protein
MANSIHLPIARGFDGESLGWSQRVASAPARRRTASQLAAGRVLSSHACRPTDRDWRDHFFRLGVLLWLCAVSGAVAVPGAALLAPIEMFGLLIALVVGYLFLVRRRTARLEVCETGFGWTDERGGRFHPWTDVRGFTLRSSPRARWREYEIALVDGSVLSFFTLERLDAAQRRALDAA